MSWFGSLICLSLSSSVSFEEVNISFQLAEGWFLHPWNRSCYKCECLVFSLVLWEESVNQPMRLEKIAKLIQVCMHLCLWSVLWLAFNEFHFECHNFHWMAVRSYWVQDWKATSVGVWARGVTDSPHGLPLTVLWSPREPAVLQEENVDLSGRFLWKVDLGPLHIETSLGSSTIPDPFASLLEGIWNLEAWASTHLGQEVPVWWGIRTRRWPREEDFLYG